MCVVLLGLNNRVRVKLHSTILRLHPLRKMCNCIKYTKKFICWVNTDFRKCTQLTICMCCFKTHIEILILIINIISHQTDFKCRVGNTDSYYNQVQLSVISLFVLIQLTFNNKSKTITKVITYQLRQFHLFLFSFLVKISQKHFIGQKLLATL